MKRVILDEDDGSNNDDFHALTSTVMGMDSNGGARKGPSEVHQLLGAG